MTDHDHDDHTDCVVCYTGDYTDPGLIEGSCSTCGHVRYSRTTATRCHRAGSWRRCDLTFGHPHYESLVDNPHSRPISPNHD